LGDEKTTAFRLTPVQAVTPGSPDLIIAMSRSGNFNVGGEGVYTVMITNVGMTTTSGVITITDALPPGLAVASVSGSGWTCAMMDPAVICTNSSPVKPGASSTITLTVDVGPEAYPGVTNLATVSNASDLNISNNIIGDPTIVVQP
jgi:uncharacterized repeat protein (TIGR01451 family)